MTDFFNPDSVSLGAPQVAQPFNPVAGLSDNPLLQTAATLGQQYFGPQLGLPNLGLFQQGNLYNNYQQQEYLRQQQQMMALAAQSRTTQERLYSMARGAAAMTNTAWTPDMENYVKKYSPTAGSVLGFMTPMAPEFMDLAGFGGLASAYHLGRAGQYMRDPLTGASRLSADTGNRLQEAIYSQYYGDLKDAAGNVVVNSAARGRRDAAGLMQGQMTNLFTELYARGEIGGNDVSGRGEGNLDSFTQNMVRSLERKKRLVATMGEIFGENGRPNAPMRQLLDALEAFTGGSEVMDASRTETLLRRVQNTARSAGLTLEATGAMYTAANAQARALGLEGAFVPGSVAQAQDFRAASLGGGVGYDRGGWGRNTLDQAVMKQQSLSLAGQASEQQNFINTLTRLAEVGKFKEGSPQAAQIRRMIAEAQSGEYSKETLEFLATGSRQAKLELMSGGFEGLSASGAAFEMDRMGMANRASGFRNNAGMGVASLQWNEVVQKLGGVRGGSARNTLERNIAEATGGPVNGAALADISRSGMEALRSLAQEDGGERAITDYMSGGGENYAQGEAFLLRKFKEQLRSNGINVSDEQAKTMMRQYYGSVQYDANKLGFQGNLSNLVSQFNPKRQEAMRRNALRNEFTGAMQSAALGRIASNPLTRALDEFVMQGRTGQGDWTKIAATTLGLDANQETTKLLAQHLQSLDRASSGYNEAVEAAMARAEKAGPKGSAEYEAAKKREMADLERRAEVYAEERERIMADIEKNPALKRALEEHQSKMEKEAGGGAVEMNIGQLFINGTLTMNDGKGKGEENKPGGRGAAPVGAN